MAHGSIKKSAVIYSHQTDIYAPSRSTPSALVIGLHRAGTTNEDFEAMTQLVPAGAARHWVLAFPNGARGSWNGGNCCGHAARTDMKDVAYLKSLIPHLKRSYRIPASAPTIIVGSSNGAMLAARFLCSSSNRLVSGAVLHAGNLQDPSCKVMRAPHILWMRGRGDTTVPIAGSLYHPYLQTHLLADSTTLGAFKYGSPCKIPYRYNRGGISSTILVCGAGSSKRELRMYRDNGGHGWSTRATPGRVNSTALTVSFIESIVRRH